MADNEEIVTIRNALNIDTPVDGILAPTTVAHNNHGAELRVPGPNNTSYEVRCNNQPTTDEQIDLLVEKKAAPVTICIQLNDIVAACQSTIPNEPNAEAAMVAANRIENTVARIATSSLDFPLPEKAEMDYIGEEISLDSVCDSIKALHRLPDFSANKTNQR